MAPTLVLARPPALAPLLARGALLSPLKRPRPDAGFPRTRLTLPAVRIDPAHLTAYERICGFPTGEDALPLTYPHVLAFPLTMRLMSDRAFPLPLLGLVHTSIEITRHRKPSATSTHELSVHIEGLTPHRRGTETTVLTELRADGTPVWQSRSTYLSRHGKATHSPAPPPPTPLPALDTWRLPAHLGRRYAAVSGDRNPIHLHPITARLFGFPRAVAHGMWTVARCLAAHGTPEVAVEVHAHFKSPVLLPGTVTYGARDGRFELRGVGSRLHVTGEVHPA